MRRKGGAGDPIDRLSLAQPAPGLIGLPAGNRPRLTTHLPDSLQDGPYDESAHLLLPPEPHLALRRMDVDVDIRRIALKEQDGPGIPPLRQRVAVTFQKGEVESPAVDGPAVDEGHQLVPRRAALPRPPDKPAQAQARLGGLDREQTLSQLAPKYLADPLGQGRALGGSKHNPSVLDQRKGDARTRQGIEADALHQVG